MIATNSGTLTGSGINTTSVSGPYTQNGTGSVQLAGTITTINQPISFSSAVTLVDDAVLNAGNGNITLSQTINGAYDLTLTMVDPFV